jgi:hypothetical protein
MGTLNARQLVTQQTNYLRKRVTFADFGTTVVVGYLPAGAMVTSGGVQIVTVFNSSGTDLLDVGFIGATTDPDAYASALTLAAIGFIPFDELGAVSNIQQANNYTVTATLTQSVADATTGVADIVVFFVPNNDG